MGGKGNEGASQKTRPKGVGHTEAQGEIEELEFVQGCRQAHHFRPSSGYAVQKDKKGQGSPGEIDAELNDVIPDHRPHSSIEGVDNGDHPDHNDTPLVRNVRDHG